MMTELFPATFAAIGDMSRGRVWAIVLGILLAIVAISLLVASWTKWGQTKSLTKCIAIAFLAHVWLLMYAYGTRIITPGFGGGNQGGVRTENLSMAVPLLMMETPTDSEKSDEQSDDALQQDTQIPEPVPAPWEAPLNRLVDSTEQPSEAKASELPIPELLRMPELPKPATQAIPILSSESDSPELPPIESDELIARLAALPNRIGPPLSTQAVAAPSLDRNVPQPVAPQKRQLDQQPIPVSYQMRLSPQRQQIAMQNGGDVNTESAVERALDWLARTQGPDGGWNAAEHGAGRPSPTANDRTEAENRQQAGLKANTAMTGLALLSFLGAGHTHTEGQYKNTVANGLRYLLSQQFPSGDLSGRDQVGPDPTVRFARMYSHGMAALAITEAYGMTGDPALLSTIQSACQCTLSAMNPKTGGWRYGFRTEDPGDLSQFGWQAMVLNSASNHQSFALPQQSRLLMQRFLDSVSTGRHGGLAVYRPRSGQMPAPEQATPAMTAEAMASRLLLGFPLSPAGADEGQRLLLKNLPGRSEENLYYWYYATLAMYQLRGDPASAPSGNGVRVNSMEDSWKLWNESLKQQLCSTQVPAGHQAGSWNPSCIWGGYGGRVYSTAVACMCLEVYYRYLPMYKSEQFANQFQPARR